MTTLQIYINDKLYVDLIAAQSKLNCASPGTTACVILRKVFADDRAGERLRAILDL